MRVVGDVTIKMHYCALCFPPALLCFALLFSPVTKTCSLLSVGGEKKNIFAQFRPVSSSFAQIRPNSPIFPPILAQNSLSSSAGEETPLFCSFSFLHPRIFRNAYWSLIRFITNCQFSMILGCSFPTISIN